MGKMTVPCPLTTRVPRKPYTTRASCGPAFRYNLANILMRSIVARTIRPMMIQISTNVPPNISPPVKQNFLTTKPKTSKHRGHRNSHRPHRCSTRRNHFEIAHNALGIAVPEINFALRGVDHHPTVAPHVGAKISDTANAVAAERTPRLDGVRLNLFFWNRTQAVAHRADVESGVSERIMEAAPRREAADEEQQKDQTSADAYRGRGQLEPADECSCSRDYQECAPDCRAVDFLGQQGGRRKRSTTGCAQIKDHEGDDAQGDKKGGEEKIDRLTCEVVGDDAFVRVVHKPHDEVREGEHRPGKDCVGFLAVDDEENHCENGEHERNDAQAENKGSLARHPSIGPTRGVEVRRHAERKVIPRAPEAESDGGKSEPHGPRQCAKKRAVHESSVFLGCI